MHIPDGYLSPATYITSYIVSAPLLFYGFKKLKEKLNDKTFPLISTLTALSFLIMMINIPIPGGTSGHAIGTAVLSILFDPWIAYISISLVLFIQAVIFGDGGITAWGVNSLAMGFVASWTAFIMYRFFKNLNKTLALFVAGWSSLVASSFVIALILGIQPYIAHSPDGKPLFFPFDLKITIPAVVGTHALYFGVIEGVFTILTIKFIEKINAIKVIKNAKV
jgi:cobalt/nickel transport system permease protein